MNVLHEIRELTKTPPKMLSKLLSITVHSYIACEQGRMTIPAETLEMLSKMYCLDTAVIAGTKPLNFDAKQRLKNLEKLAEEEKLLLYATRILGKGVPATGKNIRAQKEKILLNISRESIKSRG